MSLPLVIYHGGCVDGYTAAWCFWKKYGDQAEYIGARHDSNAPNVSGRDVYLVDFCYKRPEVVKMVQTANSVTLIDHHKTAIEATDRMPGLKTFLSRNDDRCGAILAWEFLYKDNDPPPIFKYIDARDRWQKNIQGTDEISAWLHNYDFEWYQWDKLMMADENAIRKMIEDGALIVSVRKRDLRKILRSTTRRMTIGGHNVPAANIPHTLISEAGHELCQGEDFSACYYDTKNGRKFELRSEEKGMDVSLIAEQYGGGGHQHAAGFEVPRNHPLAVS